MTARSLAASVVRRVFRATGFQLVRARSGLDPLRDIARWLGPTVTNIFDVGANVGQTASSLARHFPAAQIYSFEPDPDVFGQLAQNVQHLRNVSPQCIALDDRRESRVLFVAKGSVGSSLLPFTNDPNLAPRFGAWATNCGQKEVAVARLDDFCAERGIASVDLLKADTQGNDLHVLLGAGELLSPSSIRLVFCEVNFISIYEGQASFEDIYRHLASRGYRLAGLYNQVRDPSGHLMWCDALFL